MKKFSKIIYVLILAMFVLSLSGCHSHNSRDYSGNSSTDTESNSTNSTDNSTNDNTSNDTNNNNQTQTQTENEDEDSELDQRAVVTKEDGIIKIELSNASTSSVETSAASTLYVEEYVWHVDADHDEEYWTNASDSEIYEDEILANVGMIEGVYVARDIRYVPSTLEFSSTTVAKEKNGQDKCYVSYYGTKAGVAANTYILAALPADNGSLETVKAAMTHTAAEAAKYPVLHITKPGIYELSGTWQGQIYVDIPDKSVTDDLKSEKDPNAKVTLILNGLTVNCGVAPALVIKNVYECGDDHESSVATSMSNDPFSVGEILYNDAGAVIQLAAGTTNSLTGTNLPRLNKLKLNDDDYSESDIGKYVKAQKKLYKFDAALHSKQSLVITNEGATDGTLNITSDYEGLGSELHMLIDSGNVKVTADDDGINVNEDNVSVFTQTGGTLTISSTGGDGIDSNGYVSVKNCTLNITAGSQAQNSAGEAGIDAEKNVTIDSSVTYNYTAVSGNGNGGTPPDNGRGDQGGTPPTPPSGGQGPSF